MTCSATYPAPNTPDAAAWGQERRDVATRRAGNELAELQRLVHNYNETQGMACTAIRMDPYSPCNGSLGQLCMQCPRKKGVALTTTQLPG